VSRACVHAVRDDALIWCMPILGKNAPAYKLALAGSMGACAGWWVVRFVADTRAQLVGSQE
jgi:hypothetical protein